eukprot:Skav231210  [mRNA]  locus=scaffold2958:85828:91822:- [translate_table: standard]
MPGWHEIGVTPGSPPEVRPGDVIELQVYDDGGKKQGTILVGTLRIAGEHRGGQVVEGMFLGAEDLCYHWWMNDGEGSPDKDKGFYHLCSTKVGKCSRGAKFPKMIHSDRYRIHRGTPVTAKVVPWLGDKIIREGYEFCRKKFDGVIKLPASKSKASKAEGKTAAKAAWAGEDPGREEVGSPGEEEGEEESPESASEDEGMRAKIEDLRKQLKRAEEEAAGKKKARATARGKKKGRSKDRKKTTLLKAKKEASSTPKKRKRKKKKRKEKSDPAPKGTGDAGSKQKRKRSTGEGSGKSHGEHRAKKDRVDDKGELEDSYYEYETEEDEEKEKLFESRPLEGVGKSSKEHDRGPFGGGDPVKFKKGKEESSEESDSDFRKGLTTSTKSGQLRLLSYTAKHPGRLASRLLLKMEAATARGVVGPNRETTPRTPRVAMNHVLTILLPNLGQKAGLRTMRELKTLGGILDHLAEGAPARAADMVAQRIKALERATLEGHWAAAQHLELLPPEGTMLLDRDEEIFLAKELVLDQKVKGYEKTQNAGELVAWIRTMLPELDSPLSGYVKLLRELEDELPEEGTPDAVGQQNLYPVRVSLVEERLKGKPEEVRTWVTSLVEVFNYHATMGKPRLGPPALTGRQDYMITRLTISVERFLGKGGTIANYDSSREAIKSVKFDYGGEPVQYMETLEASKVIPCWPKVGEAAIRDATDFVPEEVRKWLDDPRSCLLPEAAWPDPPPISRVRASDEEWEKIVKAGVERGMMCRVDDDQVFRDKRGRPVLNGAGGVKKVKNIGGEEKALQRFTSILVPSNSYQHHMPGDDLHLPYLGQMSMMEIDEDEEVLIDSEDLTSCFNLFRLPKAWSGFCTFAKKVSASVFGGSPNDMVYVGMSVVPMGWINSVALMQTVVRTLVFGISGVPEASEVSKMRPFPTDDSISVVYLDSYDELRKVKAGYSEVMAGKPSERHEKFVATCGKLGLPLNHSKRLVGAVHGSLQGGDFDGQLGIFEASHDKKMGILMLAMALLGRGRATERTLDEVITVVLLLPILGMNLRAAFDPEVTITDASPTGGGGAVATEFKGEPDTVHWEGNVCYRCDRRFEGAEHYPCPAGCGVALCSLDCITHHRDNECRRKEYVIPKFGERFSGPRAPLSHAVAKVGGIEVQPPFDLKSNDMALRGLKRGKGTFGTNRYLTVEHPWGSWLWYFAIVRDLTESDFQFAEGTACCFGGEREKWYALLNNIPGVQAELHRPECPGHPNLLPYEVTRDAEGNLHYATEEEAEYKEAWCQAYARGLKAQLVHDGWIAQGHAQGRITKLRKELEKSTARLAEMDTAKEVASEVAKLEGNMKKGLEQRHLREMARRTSIRGTDLRLGLGDNGMEVPYPAYRWYWHEVLSYPWKESRHINEGEVSAFNVMLRRRSKDPAKHEMSVERFLAFTSHECLPLRTAKHLDYAVGEYLNMLYQEGDSLAQGGHLLSGLKRFKPQWRAILPSATQYYKNWQKIHRPERAVPISWDLLQALAGLCFTLQRPTVALMFYVGFFCFLRTSEMLSLQCFHLAVHPSRPQVTVIVPFAKTSNGNPQVLVFEDEKVWRLARHLLRTLPKEAYLWCLTQGSFRQFWYQALAIIGFGPNDYSPYGIRRGGATWFFLETASMDATLHRGRWSSNKTAKQYVDEGTLAMAKFFWNRRQHKSVRKLALKGVTFHKRLRQEKDSGHGRNFLCPNRGSSL